MSSEQPGVAGIGNMPTLRMGSSGPEVRHLQQLLNSVSGAGLVEDGDFGPATDRAVRTFQSARGLEADGIVGPRTWAALLGTTGTPGGQGPRADCINGWTVPPFGSELRKRPLDLLRWTQGYTGQFEVPDIRYFVGPDDANKGEPRDPVVERWYGKVIYIDDRSFRVRFLATRRPVGEGIAAVAPFDSVGFHSPDWVGFDGEGGSSPFPNLPGLWPGLPYDYVAAHQMPDECRGCLDGG